MFSRKKRKGDMKTASTKRIKRSCAYLPEEIVEDILSRLPAKSVNRFRCVSRSWNTILSSPTFVHLHQQRARAGHAKLFFKPPQPGQRFYSWQPGGGPPEKILNTYNHIPLGSMVFPITKSCHGLVLLRCLEYCTHYVWNPSTGEIMDLPERSPLGKDRWRPGDYWKIYYGMGYCATTKRYKVVRMFNARRENTMTCEVFTLDESAFWRPAVSQPPMCELWHTGIQGAVFCNGNLHFLRKDGFITTFNVRDETFGILVPPPELCSPELAALGCAAATFNLTELDGSLCAYYAGPTRKLDPDDSLYIWLLRDYEAGRWEELRCIDWATATKHERKQLASNWMAPLDMYHDGSGQKKKIMFGTGSCKVFVADPVTGAMEILFSAGKCYDSQFPTMGLFEESLMPVGRTSEEIIYSSQSTETWSEILKWLPARTLGQLSQVCKEWRAMIKTNCFVSTHVLHANSKTSPRVKFVDVSLHKFIAMDDALNMPPLVDIGFWVVCSKPCHGLNVWSFANYDFVCNPVTGYCKTLPVLDNDGGDTFAGRVGIAFCTETNNHVLVRLAYKQRNQATRDFEMECQVQCPGEKLWYQARTPPMPVADMPPAHVDGKLYWMVDPELGPTSPSCKIMVLDVTTFTFEVLQGPPCSHESGRKSIVELGGAVCVTCSHRSSNAIDIWAMQEGGVWSVLYRLELARFSTDYSSEETTPLAVHPNDGRILLTTRRALGYYDPRTSSMETFYRLRLRSRGKKFIPILYQESLVHPCDARR